MGGLITIFVFVFSFIAQANQLPEETTVGQKLSGAVQKVGDAAQKASDDLNRVMKESRDRRENASQFVLGTYSPIDLLVPGKWGVTAGAIQDADRTWEFEYVRGSVAIPFLVKNLGQMVDQRYSLIKRSYFGTNSFNLSYGITYFDFAITLGDALLNKVSGGVYPGLDLVQAQSFGFNVGIGNRWTFSHGVTFGVDWISWSQPIVRTRTRSDFLTSAASPEDRDDVDQAVKIISYFPRIALFKLQLGILF